MSALRVLAAVALSSAHGADPAYGQLELFSAAFSKVRAVTPVRLAIAPMVSGLSTCASISRIAWARRGS